MPGWMAYSFFAFGAVLIIVLIARFNTNRQIERTLARRPNPTKRQFLEMMSFVASLEVAEFIWDSGIDALEFYRKPLTLHPDDDLAADLPIDEDEWGLDWPAQWAQLNGKPESELPDWPGNLTVTVRNYARWLDSLSS